MKKLAAVNYKFLVKNLEITKRAWINEEIVKISG